MLRIFWLMLNNEPQREAIKVIVSVLGLSASMVAGIALIWTIFDANQNRKLTQERLITDRFSRSVQLLDSEIKAVRTGGIFTLERISNASPNNYRESVFNILVAYVRENSSIQKDSNMKDDLAPDIEAALTVLGRNRSDGVSERIINLSFLNLKSFNLADRNFNHVNMKGSNLSFSDFSNTKLNNSDLSNVDFTQADLSNAELISANLRLSDLSLVNLAGADIRDADISDANFRGASNLLPSQVKSAKNWQKAEFDQNLRKQLGIK